MDSRADLRPSPIAGQWYSDDPVELAGQIDGYLAGAQLPDLQGQVVAVIAPHAGHLYSGPVAGYAFRAIAGQSYDLVAVVAPMHRSYPQPLLTTQHSGYATPLGPVFVDAGALAELDTHLKDGLGFGLTPVSRDGEHSLEIELPFLQRAVSGDFLLLPVMVRDQSKTVMQALGRALAETLRNKSALLVASTDLSHFNPAREAEAMDREMLSQMESFSPEGLYRADRTGRGYACGMGPVAAVLWAARELGAVETRVLRYASSGDVTGDYSSVVGYGAAVVLKPN